MREFEEICLHRIVDGSSNWNENIVNLNEQTRYCTRHQPILRKDARPPTEVMVIFVDQHKEQYGVEPICEQIQIAPSSYYQHKARERAPDRLPDRIKRDKELESDIQRVWKNNFKVYGANKVDGSCYEKALLLLAALLNG